MDGSEVSSPQSESSSILPILPLSGTLQIDGISYKLVSHIPNKRGKTSWIWKNGLKLESRSDSAKLKNFWMCQLCYSTGKTTIYLLNSISHASNYLKDSHQLFNR